MSSARLFMTSALESDFSCRMRLCLHFFCSTISRRPSSLLCLAKSFSYRFRSCISLNSASSSFLRWMRAKKFYSLATFISWIFSALTRVSSNFFKMRISSYSRWLTLFLIFISSLLRLYSLVFIFFNFL